jgi:hypothetical protein
MSRESEYALPTTSTGQWVAESMRLGPSLSLAKRLAGSEDWSRFSFKTFARAGLSDAELVEFAVGNKASSSDADEWLMELLCASPLTVNGMFLVEDWRPSPDSPFLVKMKLPTLFVADEVYFLLRERDPRQVENWRRIFSNTVPTFHAFVFADDPRAIAGASISTTVLDEIATHLRMIICGAYDGESYVVGTKLAP